jgi:hypothetical protein
MLALVCFCAPLMGALGAIDISEKKRKFLRILRIMKAIQY